VSEGTIEQVIAGEATWCVVTGDCLDVMATMPNKCVDHVITDPPYSEHTHSKQWIGATLTDAGKPRVKTAHRELGFDPITAVEALGAASQFVRIAKRWGLIFSDLEGIELWRSTGLTVGLDYVRTCIWDKVDSAPQFTGDRPAAAAEALICLHPAGRKSWHGGGRRNVFRHEVNAERGGKPHPSTKPTRLMLELVELFTDVGDLVLDAYCGSASTGIAAIRLGRRFVGIEKDPKWSAVARDRLLAEERGSTYGAMSAGQEALFR
jgi:site-specific DNA-methyltransferase (adenine-specific)